MRARISAAALLVNVTARMDEGGTCRAVIRCAIRCVMTLVLPLPAPARISTGPSVASTASRCWGLRPERKSTTDTFSHSMFRRSFGFEHADVGHPVLKTLCPGRVDYVRSGMGAQAETVLLMVFEDGDFPRIECVIRGDDLEFASVRRLLQYRFGLADLAGDASRIFEDTKMNPV